MGYEIEFYQTEGGKVPVAEFIRSLGAKQIAKILRDLDLLKELGEELHYPYVDSIKGERYKGLMEIRTKHASDIFRTFYFVVRESSSGKNGKAVLLHAIQKKTNKTPKKELETALARMNDYNSRR